MWQQNTSHQIMMERLAASLFFRYWLPACFLDIGIPGGDKTFDLTQKLNGTRDTTIFLPTGDRFVLDINSILFIIT
jgi:hypothetical protein